MKKIYLYFILFLTAVSVSTCVMPFEEEQRISFDGAYGIDIAVMCTTPGTKAEPRHGAMHGVDSLNENKVKYVDWFIFKSQDDTDDAFLSGRTTITQGVNQGVVDTAVVVKESISFDDYVDSYNSKSFYVYTIANLPVDYSYNASNGIMKGETVIGKKLADLRNIALTASFGELRSDNKFKPQDSFVMSGGKSFTFSDDDKGKLKKVVTDLKRVASKITLKLNIAPAIDEIKQNPLGGMEYITTWYPVLAPVIATGEGQEGNGLTKDLNGIQVYMSFANNEGQLELASEGDLPTYDQETFFTYNRYAYRPRYSYTGNAADPSTTVPSATPDWDSDSWNWNITGTPFYTYPMTWESDSPQAPFIKIILEWRSYIETDTPSDPFKYEEIDPETHETRLVRASRSGANSTIMTGTKEFYYKLSIPEEAGFKLLSNDWYELTFNVSILGSLSDELPLELRGQYCVADWSDPHVEAGGDLVQGSYLSTDSDIYYIYSGDDINIPVHSSHNISATVDGAAFTDYSATTPTEYRYPAETNHPNGINQKPLNINTTINSVQWDRRPSVTPNNGTSRSIDFHHKLMTDINTATSANPPDVSTYTFTVTITNTAGNSKTIKIVQYPPLRIEADLNSRVNTYGTVYINNTTNAYGGVNGLGTGTNANRNMYIITTSVANSDTRIADPRSSNIDYLVSQGSTQNYNWTNTARRIGSTGTNYRMIAYYPSDKSDLGANTIAPKLRIASSYGRTSALSYQNAQRRCATYQEDGIPAGRWRIPTYAEIDYMIKLSNIGVIPSLFNVNPVNNRRQSGYFCADGGAIFPQNDGTLLHDTSEEVGTSAYFVRCVYDEWYWGTDDRLTTTTRTQFHWGDKQIQ